MCSVDKSGEISYSLNGLKSIAKLEKLIDWQTLENSLIVNTKRLSFHYNIKLDSHYKIFYSTKVFLASY
jgi:hypothetical protein